MLISNLSKAEGNIQEASRQYKTKASSNLFFLCHLGKLLGSAMSLCVLPPSPLHTQTFYSQVLGHYGSSVLCQPFIMGGLERRGDKKKSSHGAATLCSIHLQSLEGRRASVLPREDIVHAPV